jgi:hypothetical protein
MMEEIMEVFRKNNPTPQDALAVLELLKHDMCQEILATKEFDIDELELDDE